MRKFFPNNAAILFFTFIPYIVFSQYNETFSVASRGIIAGPCGALPNTCANFNFAGVNWTISGNLAGMDAEGFLTVGGVMSGSDVDDEVCWVSPVLSLSGPSNISVDLTWTNYDFDDFIDLEWEINGSGTWIQLPNQTGQMPTPPVPQYNTSLNTIGYNVIPGNNVNGSATVMAASIGASGNTIKVRVCGDNNLSTEVFTLDNVSVTNASPLPVNWSGIFLAPTEKGYSQVSWQTATEINNDYFDIERCLDGINFTSVGQVKGSGNRSEPTNYEFLDETSRPGNTYYYRLKQVDYDGRHDYSIVLSIQIKGLYLGIKASPNPADDMINIQLDEPLDSDLKMDLIRMDGTIVRTISILEGEYTRLLDVSDLADGIYLLKSKGADIIHQKIVKSGQ